jgi:hypothetical protein
VKRILLGKNEDSFYLKLNKWEVLEELFKLGKRAIEGPHKVIRKILGDTDEARYMDAGFYLTSTGWTSKSVLQFFHLDATVPTLGFVFGLVLIMIAFSVIAKKHKLEK